IDALQAYFAATFRTKQVRVRESGSVVTLEPIAAPSAHADALMQIKREQEEYDCPLLGAGMGSKLTVDKFLEMTREEGENW
ncbi:MAG: hypothetical protein LBL83_01435, partial [Clostridiales bacterium]|nr:hypothetical protein [Clostridiales bacterium]